MLSRPFAACAIALSLFVCSCTGGVAHGTARLDSPQSAAESIVTAIENSDRAAFLACLTGGAREALEAGEGFDLSSGGQLATNIGKAVVTGNEAAVPLTAEDDGEAQSMTLLLRKVDSEWRMYGIRMSAGTEGEITIDFQEMARMTNMMAEQMASSMQDSWNEALERQKAHAIAQRVQVFEQLRGLDNATFEQSWRNSTDFSGQTVEQAVTALAGELGLQIETAASSSSLQATVDTEVAGLSKIEAIERLCAQVSLAPVWPSVQMALQAEMSGESTEEHDRIRFEPASDDRHVSFAGPFAVRVTEVVQNVPYARGSLRLTTSAFGLDIGVLGSLTGLGETNVIDHVRDASGASLMAQENIRFWGGGTQRGTSFDSSTKVELKNMLRSVNSIGTAEGSRRLRLPQTVESIEFESPKIGDSGRVGDYTVKVKSIGASFSAEIEGSQEHIDEVAVFGRALDSSGNDMEISFDSASKWGRDKVLYSMNTDGSPAKFMLKIVTRSQVLEYPWSFSDIALDRHAEMPEALESLTFTGSQPITMTFDGFHNASNQFPEAKLTITNHTNKLIQSATATFVYVDAKRKKLGDHMATIQGDMTMNGTQPLAEPGATTTKKQTAFFRPDGTESMTIKLESIEFMDGSTWPEEKK